MGDRFDPWGGMPERPRPGSRDRFRHLRLDDSEPPRRHKGPEEFPVLSSNRLRSGRRGGEGRASGGLRAGRLAVAVVIAVAAFATIRTWQRDPGAFVAEVPRAKPVAVSPAPVGATAFRLLPYSDETRCAWFNDEADRLRSSGLSGGQAVAAAGALRQKAAESYCLPGGQGLPTYPSMHHVEGDIFRLKDGEECRWAKVQFLQIASMPHDARTLLDAGNHRQRVREAGCYRY